MKIEDAVRKMLVEIGEDPERQGLKNTPERISKMYEELTSGYRISPEEVINDAIFDEKYDEMVVVKDVEFYSLCEHHMLPFVITSYSIHYTKLYEPSCGCWMR